MQGKRSVHNRGSSGTISKFRRIFKKKQAPLKETTLLEKALSYATKMHAGEKRLSGESYITHPIGVKNILELHPFSDKVLCAALLHDVLEHAKKPRDVENELYDTFGDEVLFLVDAVTKDQSIPDKKERFQFYQEKFTSALKRDYCVMFLKAADLLDNLKSLEFHHREKQREWIHELKDFYLHHFLENFYRIPEDYRDFFHFLIYQLQKFIDDFEQTTRKPLSSSPV